MPKPIVCLSSELRQYKVTDLWCSYGCKLTPLAVDWQGSLSRNVSVSGQVLPKKFYACWQIWPIPGWGGRRGWMRLGGACLLYWKRRSVPAVFVT